jgi:hypothetical protein
VKILSENLPDSVDTSTHRVHNECMTTTKTIKTARIRAGLYQVTSSNGRVYRIEQIRTETPGYGVENLWWISAADNGAELYIDPQATKADALDALEAEARSL